MNTVAENGKTIFLQTLDLPSPQDRQKFLDAACAGDSQLRQEVEQLLAHHEQAGEFLESPPTELVAAGRHDTTPDAAAPELDFLAPAAGGQTLGRLGYYDILEVIGSGGFGVVLKARDSKLDRIVAIKTLTQALASSATARQRFVREAKAAAAVNHENVVDIHAVADDGPVPYLVMEYVHGVSLDERLKQSGTLDLRAILRIGMQIAAGLAAAHQQGLVHRDVKPANILLQNGVERVKITDFGLARTADDVALTQTGIIAGTPSYMSPEQAHGEAVDHRSDLFSLGSVLYALCTGRSPFRAETTMATLRRVCEDSPRPIRDVNPDIPDWLTAIIARLLAKAPAERFQTATEVADLLGQHLAQLQHPAPAPLESTTLSQSKIQNPKSKIPNRWSIAAAAAVLLLLIGVSLTEATGVTQFAPTVMRIITGEGTLVVEVNDPAVRVTVEGDGGLIITGAGLEEIRLRPGSYRVHADKDGQPLPLDKDLVTLTRFGRAVVKVKLETTPAEPLAGKEPPPSAIAPFDAATAKEHQDAWANHLGVPVEFANSIGMRFRLIPPGEFEMGSTPQDIEAARAAEKYSDDQAVSDALTSEGPIHRVLLSEPFYLSVTEVTQKDFETVTGENPSSFRPGGENAEKVKDTDTSQLPVQRTSWNDAANFCSQLSVREGLISNYQPVGSAVRMLPGNGYRLPREAQWEFACRGGTTTRFWFGNDPGDHANREWLVANSAGRPQRVGSLAKNPFGLFDMHGNVSEWVQDGWNPESYLLSKDRPAVDPLSKPKGPHQHMVRGGAWKSKPAVNGRSAFRMPAVPSQRYAASGIRVALSVDSARQVIERQRSITPLTEQGAFVVIGGKDVPERKFDTMADAVRGASDGDTIEIRGNGPFLSEPINIQRTALTIRAGEGFRPVVKLSPDAVQRDVPLLATNAALVLEGLELHRALTKVPEGWRGNNVVQSYQAPLRAANCRFRAQVFANHSPARVFRNCEFLSERSLHDGRLPPDAQVRFQNCLYWTKGIAMSLYYDDAALHGVSIDVNGGTFVNSYTPLWLGLSSPLPVAVDGPQPISLAVSDSIFDAPPVLGFDQRPDFLAKAAVLPPTEAEAAFLRLLQWRGERNLFPSGSVSVRWAADGKLLPPRPPASPEEWKRFWGGTETDSLEGSVRFQGGNLASRGEATLDQLTPDDFRLRPDSAGYRTGPDGKDLGADVDLVGPGAAYERWRKTPEYQQWLKETRQLP